ncbi:MAG TPA: GAF domain-containing protein [Anaerolineales bacterium]
MNSKSEFSGTGTGQEDRLSEFLSATIRYIPLLTSLLALGLLGIYALSQAGLVGTPAWQLPAVAIATALIGLVQLAIASLARRGRGQAALYLFAGSLGIWSAVLVLLWQNAAPVAIVMCWVATVVAFGAGLRGRRLTPLAASSGVLSAIMLWLDAIPPLDRLPASNTAGLLAMLILSGTVVLFVIGTVVVRLFRYRSLQARLVVSFVLIMAVPVIFTTAISATTAYTNSQDQFAATLGSLTSLKRGQIESAMHGIELEMSSLQQGTGYASSILQVLAPGADTPEVFAQHVTSAETVLHGLMLQYPSSHYEEVFVMDTNGHVVLASYTPDQGADFSGQDFFRLGKIGFYSQMLRFEGKQNTAGDYKLVAAEPLYGQNKQDIRGVVVAVLNKGVVYSLLAPTPGFANAETYLVNSDFKRIGPTTASDIRVAAAPIVRLILGEAGPGSAFYLNDRGQSVLGYSAWDSEINAAIVSEIPGSDVFNKALAALLLSGLIGAFAIVVAIIAALSTAQAISAPIHRLATTAGALAKGDLQARARSEEADEVGALADSFNSMAAQLQGVIGNLEQRIAERTEALEQQGVRLRAAAEVARDAASASNLDELLDRAARLIRDRFGFYHTGIFLLDEKKEYAVLRASPSEAGRKMLENQHRLRVGEQGIVGRAAATGEPRIALDTGVDPVYFSNPLLPGTHSEMALPLKTAEGTIGVIDIQSDQPEAFTQDDIAIVQVMADQLATAIQRTNLLQQVQTNLAQLEQSYQSFTATSWRTFGQTARQSIGYRFDNVRLESIKALPEDVRNALESGDGFIHDPANQILQVPLRLRGQVIGIVKLRLNSAQLPEATSTMIGQLADRLATALENARLLEDSLRRANKERAVGEITSKIGASMNMRNVLQTAVEELGRAIPGSEVVIQFRPDTEI